LVRVGNNRLSGLEAFDRKERMSEPDEPLPSGSEKSGELAPFGEKVWVQCENYRTMAYRDEGGVWRSAGTGKEVKGIIKVEWPEEQELGGA
jgi:hypothetical protein